MTQSVEQLQFVPWTIPKCLRPYVHRVTGYRDFNVGVVRREMLVVGCPLMFAFGARYRLSERRDPSSLTIVHRSFFAGMYDTYTMSENLGVTEGFQVDLTPLGAYQLLGIPMHELSNKVIPVIDVLNGEDRALEEYLGNLESWDERFQVLERFLTSRILELNRVSPEMHWAWTQLTMSHGTTPVSLLTDELQWSRKRLRDVFNRELGFPPKLIGRMLRYRRAVDLVCVRPYRSLAEIATMAGYYDQAHLHRDVQAFAGLTPAGLRRDLNSGTYVQDVPSDAR